MSPGRRPTAGVGSNQYQTKPGGAVASRAAAGGLATAVHENPAAPKPVRLKDIPKNVSGVIRHNDDGSLTVSMRCAGEWNEDNGRQEEVHSHTLRNGRWRAECPDCDTWSGCGRVKRAARNIGKRTGQEDAAWWAALGVDTITDAEKWGFLRGADAWAWNAAGATAHDARQWASKRFTIEERAAWRAVGVTNSFDAGRCRDHGMTPEEAATWNAVGVKPSDAEWLKAEEGLNTPEKVVAWAEQAGVKPAQVHDWHGTSIPIAEIRDWTRVDHYTAEAFHTAGYTPEEAASWSKFDRDPDVVKTWREAGKTPDEARAWVSWYLNNLPTKSRSSNRHSDQIDAAFRWASCVPAGVEQAAQWRALGVTNPRVAAGYLQAGLDPDGVKALGRNGERVMPINCDGHEHAIHVTWKDGRSTWKIPAHDYDSERAAMAFGLDPCECVRVMEAAKAARRKMISPGEALAWASISTPTRSAEQHLDSGLSMGKPLFDQYRDYLAARASS